MHPIFQNDQELKLYIDATQTERLDYACNRYVYALQTFFNGAWELRLKGMGLHGNTFDDGGQRVVYWNHDEKDGGFRGPHEGRLETRWDDEDEKPDDNELHPHCMYMSGSQNLDIYVSLANEIERSNGTFKTKWITLDQALDDAHNQFCAVMDRLMIMRRLVDSNHGRMVVSAHAYSISRCIRIVVGVHYEVHVYDQNTQEQCPYHVGQPVGATED